MKIMKLWFKWKWKFNKPFSWIYTVTITDQSVNPDCPIQETIEITDYESAVVELTAQDDFNPDYNISCFGASDGEINLDVSGGTDDYSFSWTGVGVNCYNSGYEDISNLSAGHTVIITSYKNDGSLVFQHKNIQFR